MAKKNKKVEAEVVGKSCITPIENSLNEWHYFPSAVYTMMKPEFLETANEVSKEYVAKRGEEMDLNPIYPVYMTDNMFNDERVKDLTDFIGQTTWNILSNQGYNMIDFDVVFYEMWCQEHHKHSSMDQHIHGGAQISGFYFLEVPENPPKILVYDPRPAKVYCNLPEVNNSNATYASTMINFTPEPGMLLFANSWLPHSFAKNPSDTPFRFIHFNLGVNYNPKKQEETTSPEVV